MQKIGVLAEQVLNIINGGHKTADIQFTYNQMVIAVGQSRDFLLRSLFWENKRLGEGDIDGAFIKDYDEVSIQLDSKKNMYYSDLPAQVMGLANDLGVYQILWQENQESSFVRIPNGTLSLMRGLEVSTMAGRQTFFKEGDKVYYPKLRKKNMPCSVLMKLIPSSASLSEDDYSYMTSELELQVIQSVVSIYAPANATMNDVGNDNIK
jgi:hypothetical protein